jgi:carboxyl-terminal processing protease
MILNFLIILIVSFSFSSAFAQQQEDLSLKDVQKVMQEILAQHVDKKEITPDVLQNSFKSYLDQFDPERIYLFGNEASQFLNLDQAELKRVLENYRQNRFTKFEELDQMIQNAILRARKYREELAADKETIFQSSSNHPSVSNLLGEDKKAPYPNDVSELKERMKGQAVRFISIERQRYGDKTVIDNKDKTLNAYFRQLEQKENLYLNQDDAGNPLSLREKEHHFATRILKAMTHSLDAHTSFFDANEAYDMKVRLEKGFKGIGVTLEKRVQGIYVAGLVKGGPAEKSGLVKTGDRVVKIDDTEVKDEPLSDVIEKLRDDSKPTVSLLLKRANSEGKEEDVSATLNREMIAVDEGRVDIDKESFEDGIIGKITLYSFYQGDNGITSEKDLREAIKNLQKEAKLKGLVLDLRENGGGFLNQAVKVAGLFITNGVVVVSRYANGEEKIYRDLDGKVSFRGPIIILTSKATASAAEIVAQALQDYGVAVIVGDEQTYGKGTIQSQTVTEGGANSYFKVTIGKYYTVSGKTPQLQGVKADIVVPSYYSKELIGEEYLEHLTAPDKIPAVYQDPLSDIDAGLKPWYVRYYIPTLQKEESDWKQYIPALKERSQKRLVLNPEYQKFLKGEWDAISLLGGDQKIPPEHDYQMQEAVSILKEMIDLDKDTHLKQVTSH